MHAPRIFIDITRLSKGFARRTPTGIDRVDLAYALHFLSSPQNEAVIMLAGGPRFLSAEAARPLVVAVAEHWDTRAGEPSLPEDVARIGEIGGRSKHSSESATSSGWTRYVAFHRGELRRASVLLRSSRKQVSGASENAIYLHTSHSGLDRIERLRRFCSGFGMKPVLFIHDLIPLRFPEYATELAARKHARRMAAVGECARLIVTNSASVADDVRAFLTDAGRPVPPILPNHLGIDPAFVARRPGAGGDKGYFVLCGTIEPRKNHLLVLQIWRDLQTRGIAPPRLVLVGRRGWENENIVDLLDRSPAVRNHVVEVPDMSTRALAELMAGARAVLMPSFAEGYGLPVVEALSLGTPVIASDIAAHREVSQGLAELIDPLDGAGWRRAILQFSQAGAEEVLARRNSLAGFAAPNWGEHFRRTEAALIGL